MAEAKRQHQFKGFQIVYENRESDKMGGWRIYEGGDEVTDEFGFVNLSDAMMFARGAAAYRDQNNAIEILDKIIPADKAETEGLFDLLSAGSEINEAHEILKSYRENKNE